MTTLLEVAAAGSIELPQSVLCSRADGGHLIVNPPRAVWERSELEVAELLAWSLLVAATGRAMLDTLGLLRQGCINYWEAGNWSLNELAVPAGPKQPKLHRRVHMHLFGRSPRATDPDWRWGESPRFPSFADAVQWSTGRVHLQPQECQAIVDRVAILLAGRYRL